MTTADRIKARRKELGLSVDEIANRLGKNRATVYRYESGDIENMPITVLEPIAKALLTTPAYLMGWEDKEKIPNNQSDINNDSGLIRIERARNLMDNDEKKEMMSFLKRMYPKYFSDDYVDEDTEE